MRKFLERIKDRKGTTLVEMMIAFTVFGILIAITVSNFKQSLEFQQLSTLLLESHDNVSLLFEQISREVRTSKNLTAGAHSITFDHQDGYSVTYSLDSGSGTIQRSQSNVNGGNPVPVTAANQRMKVEDFSAFISNSGTQYRRLTMSVRVSVYDRQGNPYPTTIQTSVSPRFYE